MIHRLYRSGAFRRSSFELDTNDNTSISSDFDESSFSNKVNMKTMAVLHVLRSGYNVLLTDVDVVLFKNPFDFFTCHCCDIHIQRDELSIKSHDRNSGFVYVKNTPRSLELFDLAWHYYEENRMIRQQPALNKAIDVMLKKQLRIQLLPLKFFVPGFLFFETAPFQPVEVASMYEFGLAVIQARNALCSTTIGSSRLRQKSTV